MQTDTNVLTESVGSGRRTHSDYKIAQENDP